MRVTHVVRQFPPSVGGLEEAVLKLCGTLQTRGVAVDVVTLDRIAQGGPETLPAAATVAGIPVRRIPFRGSWRYPVAPGVLHHIRGADVVHVHAIDFFFDFLAAARPLHRKPLVASTHGGFFHTAFARTLKQVYFRTVTRASAAAYETVFASSASDLELFRSIVPAHRLKLAVNGVDTAKWHDMASCTPARHLIYIGRFSSNKNLGALFRLLAALHELDPSWRLTIAGQPWDVTAAELRAGARAQGVETAVTLLERPGDDAIAAAIATASYVVSASRHEGFGISIVEGLSAGLIPLLSRIPPFLALLADCGVGRAIDFEDASAAAAATEALHRTNEARPAPSRAAAIRAAGRYGWDGAADVIQACYAEAIRPHAPAAGAAARLTS